FTQFSRGMSLSAAPFNPITASAAVPVHHYLQSVYPPAPLSLTHPSMTTLPFSAVNTSLPTANFATQINQVNTQSPVTTTFLPPLAYQAIVNSSFPQSNTLPNLQVPFQPTSLTPTNPNNHFRGPKVKLSFPEFDTNNPRGWIRRCDKYFELYQITPEEKMGFVSVHIKEKMDTWFDVYMMEHGGQVTWKTFCLDVCRRYDNIRPMDIVVQFNWLQQWSDVEIYFTKFEELRFYLLLINPTFNEAYFVYCFMGGLKPDLESMVRASNPQTMI
ncbi:hypothetical protein A4A49_58143, partial [Nicotiana attenuata]